MAGLQFILDSTTRKKSCYLYVVKLRNINPIYKIGPHHTSLFHSFQYS